MLPIGEVIHLWRVRKGLTQQALAERSHVSRPNLSAIEQGTRDLTVQTLRRIASALGVPAGGLVDGIGPKPEHLPPNLGRQSLDRMARLASGQWLRATDRERKTAFSLASIMKSKMSPVGTKRKRLRSVRSENATFLQLKADLGGQVLQSLIRRAEKIMASRAERP